MLRRLYDWTLGQAKHPHAERILALVSLAESSVFPVPPDVLLVPMILADRRKAWRLAFICTLASVLGGIAGYLVGAVLFEQIGRPVLAFWGYDETFAGFQARYDQWGAWVVLFAGLTPFPYKVVTILSGAAALDPGVFILASILARGLRFYTEAVLLWKYGELVRVFIERYFERITAVVLVVLIGGFILASLVP